MQRAGKNIDELLENRTQSFHRLRQSSINEELFGVDAGASPEHDSDAGGAPHSSILVPLIF